MKVCRSIPRLTAAYRWHRGGAWAGACPSKVHLGFAPAQSYSGEVRGQLFPSPMSQPACPNSQMPQPRGWGPLLITHHPGPDLGTKPPVPLAHVAWQA